MSAGTGWKQLGALGRDIKLAHTVFALPFAVLAMVWAAAWAGRHPSVMEIVLIVVCMVAARTLAMTVNRLVDARFDAANPRTAERAIPAGKVSRQAAAWVIAGSGAVFVLAACGFGWARGNWWPAALSPAVLGIVAGYSFTKRFTAMCHMVLGVALGLSPLAAALAIEPGFLREPTAWLLAGFVAGWVAGFDVIYAMADADVDRALGLHSLPSWLGVGGALWVSRGLHAAAAVVLLGCAVTSPLLNQAGLFFGAALLVVGLLVVEHALVWGSSTKRLHLAFFTVNGVISVVLGLAGVVEVW